jgi:hypothetical protein
LLVYISFTLLGILDDGAGPKPPAGPLLSNWDSHPGFRHTRD